MIVTYNIGLLVLLLRSFPALGPTSLHHAFNFTMDPFEVRMQFLGLIRKLNA